MASVDPFAANGFTLTTLTSSINKLPNRYGRLQQLGLFPIKGVSTRSIEVEERNGVLTLVPTVPWGGTANQNKSGKRTLRSFVIPHMPLEDSVLASDVQGIRAFGSENQLETVNARVNDKLQEMRDKLDQTLEYRRFGALKGILLDADGSTTLYNLYTEFGITQKTVDFALGTGTTDVLGKCMIVNRWIEDNLQGETFNKIRALVSPEFYDKLVSHANVKVAFQNWQAAEQRLGGDMRSGFPFGGIIFEEYRAQTTGTGGSAVRYIAANDGHCIPEGTYSTFETLAAPADFAETVNTMGLQYYAKQEPMKFNRGMDLHVQSNVLPICKRPELLVRIYTSN